MTDEKTRRPAGRLIAAAAVLGLVAGAAAIYVKETWSGNGAGGAGVQTAASCPLAKETVAAVTPFLKGQVAAMAPADDPRPMTGLAFTGDGGKPLTLDDFAGKTLLVNLWATWCVPCREEMPALNALQAAMGGDRFEVVAINIDTGDDEKPKAFLEETGVDALGLYRDASMGVFNTLKKEGLAFGLPVTLLLDANGCLVAAMNGPAIWDSADAKALVTAATGVAPKG
ncbi:thiol:disulfide interchange protein TlpA [Ensifer soli]|uniref:thiol:disulfide interchange protein TlpA n=1 Tax=Ciceribacter sp. sgz301302 TaxID=3342379 RepID=UPI0035B79CF3